MPMPHIKPWVQKDKTGAICVGYKGVIQPLIYPDTKKLSAKGAVMLYAFIAVLIAVVFLVVCILALPKAEIPMYQELRSHIGRDITTVSGLFGLEPDGLVQESEGVYRVPEKHKYLGIEYAIILGFDTNEGLLNRFEYRFAERVNAKNAAKNISKLTSELQIKSALLSDGQELQLANKKLIAYFESGNSLELDLPDIRLGKVNGSAITAVNEYCEYLENAEYWEGRVGKYLTKSACYYEDLIITYNADTQSQTIHIVCAVEAVRNQ